MWYGDYIHIICRLSSARVYQSMKLQTMPNSWHSGVNSKKVLFLGGGTQIIVKNIDNDHEINVFNSQTDVCDYYKVLK